MSTHYIDNVTSSPYYFNANNATTSQSSRTYSSSGYSNYPVGGLAGSYLSSQSNRIDNSYNNQSPQQYQSVAGFNRHTTTQQRYQTPQSPAPQVRASVRIVGSQDQYQLPSSSQPVRISPQQHHFQFDNRQQPGRPAGPAVVYQTPGAAQYTHRNVDLWTEGPSQGQDHFVQAQRVSVRSVSTGSPQQSHSVSPQRPQDHLQQYYSQLTPEQHQQLLRQQQLQRQQEQQRVTAQQISPPSTQRSTAGFSGGHPRPDSERQRRDEQDYYAAQRQMAAQRVPQDEQPSHPVGIRNLMTKFAGPAPAHPNQSRSRTTTTRHYSSSSYSTSSGPKQNTSHSLTSNSMTYSALPKPVEPPVNSLEYYQMQLQQGRDPFANIQQAAAPAHIQHSPMSLGGLRDRFQTGSLSDDFNRPQVINRQPPSPPQQQQQQRQGNAGGSNLSSLRNQYMNRAHESLQNELPEQPVQNISRTIVGEDLPSEKPKATVQPPAPVQQAPSKTQEAPESTPQAAASSAPEETNADEGVSSF